MRWRSRARAVGYHGGRALAEVRYPAFLDSRPVRPLHGRGRRPSCGLRGLARG